MQKPLTINGIHHITAIASSAADNLAFYRQALGLRLVKQTVNFDDPYTYHLYYGDGIGSPGTIITFFPWEKLPPGRAGAGMVTAIGFTVARSAMDYWHDRLHTLGLTPVRETRFGDPVLGFNDPHGLDLELIGVDTPPEIRPWAQSEVPETHMIRGFHSATAVLREMGPTRRLLTQVMGMVPVGEEDNRLRVRMADDRPPGIYYDIVADPQAAAGRSGGGTVHHIAFRTASAEEQLVWQDRLRDNGYAVTPVRDRNYFRSIYFNEPGGVLFEIATDSPGFSIDESLEALGRTLKLPAQYESMRAEIEAHLPPLHQEGDRSAAERIGVMV